MTEKKLENLVGLAVAAIAFVVYAQTLSPTVNFIDSGELAAVSYTLGVAHPSGYPLFTLLGSLWSQLPLGFRVIYQFNVLAAFICSVSVFFFYKFVIEFLSYSIRNRKKGAVNTQRILVSSSAFGALALAFSETFWLQALSIEVYALHLMFLSLLLFVFWRAVMTESDKGVDPRLLYIFAFILGLCFSNHLTTILLAPAFLYLYFTIIGRTADSLKLLSKLAAPFFLGLSIYVYLPIRASGEPLLNWGDPTSIERFLRHLSGKQYSVWIFSSAEVAAKQLKYFVSTLAEEFTLPVLIISLLGIWTLWNSERRSFLFTLLLFAGCLVYSINYDIHDIDSYFLLAYIAIAIVTAAGGYFILSRIKNVPQMVLIILFGGILGYELYDVKDRVDQSDMYVVEDYTRNIFNSVEKDAIIFSYQWDNFVSCSYYLQHIEGLRPDVAVIDKELLRRSWYFKQLGKMYPWLVERSRKEIDEFLRELYKFEKGIPYDPNEIEYRYSAVINSMIAVNISTHPIYCTPEIEQQYTTGFRRIPTGVVLRLVEGAGQPALKPVEIEFRIPSHLDERREGVLGLYYQAFVQNSYYFHQNGRRNEAVAYLRRAEQIYPNRSEVNFLRTAIEGNREP